MIPMYGVGDEDAKGYNKMSFGTSNGGQYFSSAGSSSPLSILRLKETIAGWLRLILSDKNSRNIFFFLLINFSFAFVELFYGFWTNSLGLISDSFHMFFDCTALLTGLLASIITKWRSNERFSYGYVRAEILAGFVNGLFLLFIAFFIFSEAVERAMEPPDVHHERLFLVSVLGLLVNLIGIFVFQHGHADGCSHGHSHGPSHGHSHSHDHSHSHSHATPITTETDHALSFVSTSPAVPNGYDGHYGGFHQTQHKNSHDSHAHGHGNDHHHHHDHHDHSHSHDEKSSGRNQIIQGVFLHIMADTLGSVGVIISALLMSQFGWMIADPICSMFIAILVVMSTYPLLRDSGAILMQRTPVQLQEKLPGCYQKVIQLPGVLSVQETHFWTLCSDQYIGNLKLEVSPDADIKALITHCQSIFLQIGIKQLYVQIDLTHS